MRSRRGERLCDLALEARQSLGEHRLESMFFRQDRLLDHPPIAPDLGIRVAHLAVDDRDQAVQERFGEAEVFAVAHRAPHDFPQHVAAPLVRRDDTVRNQECRRPDVVRDDAQRYVRRAHRPGVEVTGLLADFHEQRHEHVGVVVRLLVLQHGGDPLEAHAGIDRRRRQRRQPAVRAPLELHEHVVPDLDFRVGAAAAHEIDLRAAAARPGVAHLPEVVVEAELHDAIRRHAERSPDLVGFFIAGNAGLALEDRHHEAVGRHLPDLGQQCPGERQRVLLEVIAEGEVAEHLEEGVVTE